MRRIQLYLTTLLCMMAVSVSAQQVNTLYFLEASPVRHVINPAFQPVSRIYIGISPVSYTSFSLTNNFSMSDLIYNKDGQTVTALYPGEESKFNDKFKNGLYSTLDLEMNLLNIGVRLKHDGYLYIALNEKAQMGVHVPKDFMSFLNSNNSTIDYNLAGTSATASLYTELMGGYARRINEHWQVGGKLKFIYANAYAGLNTTDMALATSAEQWKASMKGNLSLSFAALQQPFKQGTTLNEIVNQFKTLNYGDAGTYLKAAGYGGAVDLGATYNPIDQIRISLAVTDLGMIHWTGYDYEVGGEGTYSGREYTFEEFKNMNPQTSADTAIAFLKDFYGNVATTDGGKQGANRMLYTKLNAGFDANFWQDRVGVGIYSRTSFYNSRVYEEVTIGAAFRPVHWFNLAASFSFINGGWNSMGVGLNLMPYDGLSLTIVTDYLPFSYANLADLQIKGVDKNIPVPYKTKAVNLAIGLNIVIGSNEDRRKDSDKDGIPDYIDMCPKTPEHEGVDCLGCPIDTDGDGVPDSADECPNTPHAAYGMIDDKGCPIDSDGDGVPDYMDECPGTPKESFGYVDARGCSLDSDGDGVPDYMDECPGTPAEARGQVNDHGCPLDSDGDGVPDYKDECPGTPAAAYGLVDAKGCPMDSDDDGVPDYTDDCPDSPKGAKGFVDKHGCLLDSDHDGVPDYKDECPTVAGVAANKGCPEIKKEVRTLLQKAMQGIEFENGKANIKKQSFALLNQIAVTFIQNPSYKVEVQGHTDNVGNESFNQELSEKRAHAVRSFLVDAGVPADQLTAKGYGSSRPIADNNTKAGRAKNRRVEFVISFEQISYETILDHADDAVLPTDSIGNAATDSTLVNQ